MYCDPYFLINLALEASEMSEEELTACREYLDSGDKDKVSLEQHREVLITTGADNNRLHLANCYMEETIEKLLVQVEELKAKLEVYKTKNRGLEESLTYRTNLLFK
jgi:hypothetical protein